MKNKGFTLVELLAVIVILALILAIAIPRITDLIENAKIQSYISNEEMMIRAAKNYTMLNEEELPNEIGETKGIILEQLQTGDYISIIKDPTDKNEECNGYVLITKIAENNYDYTPHLRCGDSSHIYSVEEDELVLHYKFADFQEPTENLIEDVYFESKGWTTVGGAQAVIAQGQSIPGVINNQATRITTTGGTTGGGWKYGWDSVSAGINEELLGKTAYFTMWIYNISDSPMNVRPVRIGDNLQPEIRIEPNEVKLISYGGDMVPQSSPNVRIDFRTYSENINLDVIVYRPQLEQKPYATPFVEGNREGIVKDYSINNNNATLDENTPRWVEDSAIGTGSYLFNGVDNYIDVSNSYWQSIFNNDIGNNFTISAWIKPNTLKDSVIVGQRLCDNMVFGIRDNGKLFLGMDDIGCLAWGNPIESDDSIVEDEWQHVVVRFINNTTDSIATFYINGDYNGTSPAWDGNGIEVKSDLFIGWQSRSHSNFGKMHFDGFIDDVRIYNRELSEQEIKWLYNTNK